MEDAQNPSFDINGDGTPKVTKSLDIKSFIQSPFPEAYGDNKSPTDFNEPERKHNISPVNEMMERSEQRYISPWDFSGLFHDSGSLMSGAIRHGNRNKRLKEYHIQDV